MGGIMGRDSPSHQSQRRSQACVDLLGVEQFPCSLDGGVKKGDETWGGSSQVQVSHVRMNLGDLIQSLYLDSDWQLRYGCHEIHKYLEQGFPNLHDFVHCTNVLSRLATVVPSFGNLEIEEFILLRTSNCRSLHQCTHVMATSMEWGEPTRLTFRNNRLSLRNNWLSFGNNRLNFKSSGKILIVLE